MGRQPSYITSTSKLTLRGNNQTKFHSRRYHFATKTLSKQPKHDNFRKINACTFISISLPIMLASPMNKTEHFCNLQASTRPPPRFGNHKIASRLLSSKGNDVTASPTEKEMNEAVNANIKDRHCPICAKYSKGPCGDIFRDWLQCTDENPGKNESTQKDIHIEKCFHLAKPLAECLSKYEEFYAKIPLEYDEIDKDADQEKGAENVREAWDNIVHEIESASKTQKNSRKFPNYMAPEMEVRFEANVGLALFYKKSLQCKDGKELLLAYLKDQNGKLLGAGTLEDIQNGRGSLRFGIDETTETVTLCALYGEDDGGPLLTMTQRLPPRT